MARPLALLGMPRKKIHRTNQFPYHLTSRGNNRSDFPLSPNEQWKMSEELIQRMSELYGINCLGFVLMRNHFHLMAVTPNSNIDACMKYFCRELSRRSNRRSGRINHMFGGRYFGCVIKNENYFWNCVKYIFRNPVKAGICERVEQFQFSSLNKKMVGVEMRDMFHPECPTIELCVDWLNEAFSEKEYSIIKKGLRKSEFTLVAEPSGKAVRLPKAPF